jgi:hypothetical protein
VIYVPHSLLQLSVREVVTSANDARLRILRKFADTLEQCPRMREESSRELLIANIGSRLGVGLSLRKQATPRADIIELVRVCARLPNGLDLIADELEFLDPLAPEVPELLQLCKEWQSAASHLAGMRQQGSITLGWSGIPPRNLNFTGREDLLRQLHGRLTPGTMTAVLPQALRGLGGVGKSQLAVEYAYRHRMDFDFIWWIPAERPVQIQASLVELGQRLGLGTPSDVNLAVTMVIDALRGNSRSSQKIPQNWLLIFDNAENPQDTWPYLPTGSSGRILITSRNSQWINLAQPLEVDVFRRTESIELLLRRGPDLSTNDADRLARALGDLPLAIEQAAAWRAETGMPADEYIRLLRDKQVEMLDLPGPLDYRKSVAAAWNVSLDKLRVHNPMALRLLQMCAFFAPEPIPRPMLVNTTGQPDLDLVIQDPLRLNEAIRDINRCALARIDHRVNSIQLHRLVQAILKNQMSQESRMIMRHAAHLLLAANDPHLPHDAERWPEYSELYPHIVASNAIECSDSTVRELIVNTAQFLNFWGELRTSLELSQQAYDTWLSRLGASHMDTLKIGRWLGCMLWANGNFQRSSEFNVELLEIHRATLGDDHEDTLDAMGSVAGDRRARGDFAGALELSQMIHERCVERFGHNDLLTLTAAHNVGVSLRLSGKFVEAKTQDEITYQRRLKVCGYEHPLSLFTQIGLILDRRESGDYLEASFEYEAVVARCRKIWGNLNPQTLRAILPQAGMRRKAGDYVGALAAADEAFEGLVSQYGINHPHTISAQLSRSISLRLVGDIEEANRLGIDAVERYRHVLGDDHPHTLSALTQQAVILRLLGACDDARSLNQTALDGLRARLGEDHPLTIVTAMNLASDLFALGQPQAAHELDATTAEKAERLLGYDHPISLSVMANLAQDLCVLGREEGKRLRRELHARAIARLSLEHPAVTAIADPDSRATCDIDPMPL